MGETSGLNVPSDCMQVPLAAGTWTLGFSYQVVAGSNVDTVFFYLFTSASGCFGAGEFRSLQASAISDGLWHDVSGTRELSVSASTFYVRVVYSCSATCPNSQVNFDDLLLEKVVPTSVAVSSIQAGRTAAGILVSWRSGSASDLLGFNVYRQHRGKLVKMNRALIQSVFGGTASGHRYSWLDRSAPRSGSVRYRLQAVSLSGKRSWLGAASVT